MTQEDQEDHYMAHWLSCKFRFLTHVLKHMCYLGIRRVIASLRFSYTLIRLSLYQQILRVFDIHLIFIIDWLTGGQYGCVLFPEPTR